MYIIIHADKYVKASLHLSSRWAFSRTIYIFDGFRDFLAASSETLHASLSTTLVERVRKLVVRIGSGFGRERRRKREK